jgi:hypothetical protein
MFILIDCSFRIKERTLTFRPKKSEINLDSVVTFVAFMVIKKNPFLPIFLLVFIQSFKVLKTSTDILIL